MVSATIDILLISETKLDDSFPSSQFSIAGFSQPIRMDRNEYGGGIMLYLREDIPFKEIKSDMDNVEGIFVEINLRKNKWLLFGSYNPQKSNGLKILESLGNNLNRFMSQYDNLLLLGDFNMEPQENILMGFCECYNLKNLVKEPTCFKNPRNPSCIDLILTNRRTMFQNTSVIETGISDHHKLTVTVMKSFFPKLSPTIVVYRNFSKFDNKAFRYDLQKRLNEIEDHILDYDDFEDIFCNILNKHAPMKQKYIRANNSPFMTKLLRQNICHRSKLRNKFLKQPTRENNILYKKQRNKCVKLLRNEKKRYYNKLNLKLLKNNKTFWKTIKPLFSEKSIKSKKIVLVENDEILTSENEVSEIMNTFFSEIVKCLGIEDHYPILSHPDEDLYNISNILIAYENHPSIIKIKEKFDADDRFTFNCALAKDIESIIEKLDSSKGSTSSIPPKILKDNNDICHKYLTVIYNNSLTCNNYPSSLKMSEITPVHKKDESTNKENYRPISILPTISKVFEKELYSKMYSYFEGKLSANICGFRKGYGPQYTIIPFLEKCRMSLDKYGSYGALFTDLSKAFDCLNHNLLIAKLHAYGFDLLSIQYIQSYLSGRSQRTKIG